MNFKHQAMRALTLSLAAVAALMMFTWPLIIGVTAQSESEIAQTAFLVLMPLALVLLLIEFSTGGIDARQIALLGVLTALNAVIRMLGAGTAGVETAFFLIIIAAYVFGPSFGFLFGALSLLVSGLLTGGIGPWLPFQMMAAALVGLAAGALPKVSRTWLQFLMLCGYAFVASFFYGGLMTLWNWPFLAGTGTSISYVAGASLIENLTRFLQYEIFTGGLLWDFGRAITTSVLILLTAPALLATLNRAANRAGFVKLPD
jgi:energy-coupling factor transport system substrate-specific component